MNNQRIIELIDIVIKGYNEKINGIKSKLEFMPHGDMKMEVECNCYEFAIKQFETIKRHLEIS